MVTATLFVFYALSYYLIIRSMVIMIMSAAEVYAGVLRTVLWAQVAN
jgi:hypothetical protein